MAGKEENIKNASLSLRKPTKGCLQHSFHVSWLLLSIALSPSKQFIHALWSRLRKWLITDSLNSTARRCGVYRWSLRSLLFLYKPLTNLNFLFKIYYFKDLNFKNLPGSIPLDSPPPGWLIDLNKLSQQFEPVLPYFQRPSADSVCSGCLQISGQCLGVEKKDSVWKTNQFYDFLLCFNAYLLNFIVIFAFHLQEYKNLHKSNYTKCEKTHHKRNKLATGIENM